MGGEESAQPGHVPLAQVRISRFECSSEFVIGAREVTLSWETKNAAALHIHRKVGDEEKLVGGKVNFAAGRLALEVDADTTFTLLAYPAGPDGKPIFDEEKAAECELFVEYVRPAVFYGLLIGVVIWVLGIWLLSEGLFHGTDLVDTHWVLNFGNTASRLLAVLVSVLGAPLVAALLQILNGHSRGFSALAFALLRNERWALALAATAVIPPVALMWVLFASSQVYLSSDIDRPIHIWDGCSSEGEITAKSDLRLTIPPGISSARVMLEDFNCRTPEGVVLVNPPANAKDEAPEDAKPAQAGTGAKKDETQVRFAFTCNQRVLLDATQTNGNYRERVQWDDGTTSPFDADGAHRVARKYVKDCAAFSRSAHFERRTPVGEPLEKLSWRMAVDHLGKEAAHVELTPVEVQLGKAWTGGYVTVGAGDEWHTIKSCPRGETCDLTLPDQTIAARPRYLCATPSPVSGPTNTAAACAEGQTWSYFERIDERTLDEGDTKDPHLPGLAPLLVCVPPTLSGDHIDVTAGGAAWSGTLQPHNPTIVWSPKWQGEAEVTLTVGDRTEHVLPVKPDDETVGKIEATVELVSARVTVTLDDQPGKFRSGHSCNFEAVHEEDDRCRLLSRVVATGKGQHVEFTNLPEWANATTTKWRPIEKECDGLTDQPDSCHLDPRRRVLQCHGNP